MMLTMIMRRRRRMIMMMMQPISCPREPGQVFSTVLSGLVLSDTSLDIPLSRDTMVISLFLSYFSCRGRMFLPCEKFCLTGRIIYAPGLVFCMKCVFAGVL
jgi:hypothetical protein